MTKQPLNGTKTHPLKPASLEALRRLACGPVPGHTLNPGVRDRLSRSDYAAQGDHNQWFITPAGRAALEEDGR